MQDALDAGGARHILAWRTWSRPEDQVHSHPAVYTCSKKCVLCRISGARSDAFADLSSQQPANHDQVLGVWFDQSTYIAVFAGPERVFNTFCLEV